jgi:hypothetical protein
MAAVSMLSCGLNLDKNSDALVFNDGAMCSGTAEDCSFVFDKCCVSIPEHPTVSDAPLKMANKLAERIRLL